MLERLSNSWLVDSPIPWGLVGFLIGVGLGVTTVSVWLVAIGFGAYLVYLKLHGPADHSTETWLFAAGPVFMMSWVLGFIVRGLAF